MSKVRRDAKAPRRVWRINAAAPHGEYVELGATAPVSRQQGENHHGGWAESSHDLASGLDVHELGVFELANSIDRDQIDAPTSSSL